jgi:TRAP-type transport system periplasmic protein
MSRMVRAVFALSMGVLLVGGWLTVPSLSEGAAAPQKVTLRIAHSFPLNHGYNVWAEKFAEELKSRVGDRVEVKIFPAGQLGSETQYLEAMKLGGLDGAIQGRYSEIDPHLDLLNLPFLFKDEAHVTKVLRSGGPLEKRFNDMLLAKGYVNLGWGVLGTRYVTANKAVRNPGDLKGINIRVPNTPVLLAAFKNWGANPTILDVSEVYTALQTGVVQAQENPPDNIYNLKFYEVQKFVSLTAHANMSCQLLLSKKTWDTLPADLQQAMLEAGRVSRDYQVKFVVDANNNLLGELEKKGMTIVRDVDRNSFFPGAKAVHDQFVAKYGAQWGEVIQSILDAGK